MHDRRASVRCVLVGLALLGLTARPGSASPTGDGPPADRLMLPVRTAQDAPGKRSTRVSLSRLGPERPTCLHLNALAIGRPGPQVVESLLRRVAHVRTDAASPVEFAIDPLVRQAAVVAVFDALTHTGVGPLVFVDAPRDARGADGWPKGQPVWETLALPPAHGAVEAPPPAERIDVEVSGSGHFRVLVPGKAPVVTDRERLARGLLFHARKHRVGGGETRLAVVIAADAGAPYAAVQWAATQAGAAGVTRVGFGVTRAAVAPTPRVSPAGAPNVLRVPRVPPAAVSDWHPGNGGWEPPTPVRIRITHEGTVWAVGKQHLSMDKTPIGEMGTPGTLAALAARLQPLVAAGLDEAYVSAGPDVPFGRLAQAVGAIRGVGIGRVFPLGMPGAEPPPTPATAAPAPRLAVTDQSAPLLVPAAGRFTVVIGGNGATGLLGTPGAERAVVPADADAVQAALRQARLRHPDPGDARLTTLWLIIRADARVPWRYVEPIMREAASYGIWQLAWEVEAGAPVEAPIEPAPSAAPAAGEVTAEDDAAVTVRLPEMATRAPAGACVVTVGWDEDAQRCRIRVGTAVLDLATEEGRTAARALLEQHRARGGRATYLKPDSAVPFTEVARIAGRLVRELGCTELWLSRLQWARQTPGNGPRLMPLPPGPGPGAPFLLEIPDGEILRIGGKRTTMQTVQWVLSQSANGRAWNPTADQVEGGVRLRVARAITYGVAEGVLEMLSRSVLRAVALDPRPLD